jgi:hypothetical protein
VRAAAPGLGVARRPVVFSGHEEGRDVCRPYGIGHRAPRDLKEAFADALAQFSD